MEKNSIMRMFIGFFAFGLTFISCLCDPLESANKSDSIVLEHGIKIHNGTNVNKHHVLFKDEAPTKLLKSDRIERRKNRHFLDPNCENLRGSPMGHLRHHHMAVNADLVGNQGFPGQPNLRPLHHLLMDEQLRKMLLKEQLNQRLDELKLMQKKMGIDDSDQLPVGSAQSEKILPAPKAVSDENLKGQTNSTASSAEESLSDLRKSIFETKTPPVDMDVVLFKLKKGNLSKISSKIKLSGIGAVGSLPVRPESTGLIENSTNSEAGPKSINEILADLKEKRNNADGSSSSNNPTLSDAPSESRKSEVIVTPEGVTVDGNSTISNSNTSSVREEKHAEVPHTKKNNQMDIVFPFGVDMVNMRVTAPLNSSGSYKVKDGHEKPRSAKFRVSPDGQFKITPISRLSEPDGKRRIFIKVGEVVIDLMFHEES